MITQIQHISNCHLALQTASKASTCQVKYTSDVCKQDFGTVWDAVACWQLRAAGHWKLKYASKALRHMHMASRIFTASAAIFAAITSRFWFCATSSLPARLELTNSALCWLSLIFCLELGEIAFGIASTLERSRLQLDGWVHCRDLNLWPVTRAVWKAN